MASQMHRPLSRLEVGNNPRVRSMIAVPTELVMTGGKLPGAAFRLQSRSPNVVAKPPTPPDSNGSESYSGMDDSDSVTSSSDSDLARSPAADIIRATYTSPLFDQLKPNATNDPCPVDGCPLNPKSRYMCGKAEQSLFSRSSSTSGTDSSLRIRKTRAGCTERRWFVCVSLAMIFTVLVASAGIYFGYQFLRTHLPETEKVFKGSFLVTDGDAPPIDDNTERARFYQHKLDLLLTGSKLAQSYLHNEVFLIESEGNSSLKVHFNIHVDPAKGDSNSNDIVEVITNEINASNNTDDYKSILENLIVDIDSINVQERSPMLESTTSHETPGLVFGETSTSEAPDSESAKRQCRPFQIEFCKQLPYNFTTFPNAMGHRNVEEAKNDLERFKEIVDSKCYTLTYEFLCQLLQPVCFQERMVLPCRDFCYEFMQSCGNVLPGELKDKIRCGNLATEADGPGSCISKPGCVAEMRNVGQSHRVCDGVVDCPDFSDELYCQYCPEQHFHCGVGKMCIPKQKMCDGNTDCDNGADEKGCLSLAPHMDFSSYVHQYYPSGYLVYQESGEAGKVCADHMNKTVPTEEVGRVLNKLGMSMCSLLEYRDLKSIQIEIDDEDTNKDKEVRYVDMIGPMSEDKSFINVPCNSREVVYIECNNLECGRRPAHVKQESAARIEGHNASALHGDWPWHVALYKNGFHVCDATIIGEQWLMTTSSCFQGQGKSKWVARFATVRLNSRAPWEQKRRIVGMVESPVEGNSIVLLKLETPIVFSDFARPICLPASDEFIYMNPNCVTLAWDNKEQLNVVNLENANREDCEKQSEVSANSLCAQETSDDAECNGEEYSGAPLMCQAAGEWHLVGVTSWRRGCTTLGKRPRIYDRVSVSTDWAYKTMEHLKLEVEKEKKTTEKHNKQVQPKKSPVGKVVDEDEKDARTELPNKRRLDSDLGKIS